MTLSALESFLSMRLATPLPGAVAHDLMRARAVDKSIPNFTHKLPPRPGAVLILLYEDKGSIRFPLIRRQEYIGAHSGQVSLPGGKTELGESPVETALREAEEEIGIDRSLPKVVGQLSSFFVIPSNFIITPIVATIDHVPGFRPDSYEVAAMLSGELDNLTADNAVLESEIVAAGQYRMMAPHFILDGAMVWGATAMILNEFRQLVRELNGPGQ
ncbi:CoA pyrophosphatase [Chryseolinea sp. T2]|uniref:NUDIX hydrolase n=1 Tax=Chryseolinea sp. T2 TaxID=3129255 RepID=UPI003077C990